MQQTVTLKDELSHFNFEEECQFSIKEIEECNSNDDHYPLARSQQLISFDEQLYGSEQNLKAERIMDRKLSLTTAKV